MYFREAEVSYLQSCDWVRTKPRSSTLSHVLFFSEGHVSYCGFSQKQKLTWGWESKSCWSGRWTHNRKEGRDTEEPTWGALMNGLLLWVPWGPPGVRKLGSLTLVEVEWISVISSTESSPFTLPSFGLDFLCFQLTVPVYNHKRIFLSLFSFMCVKSSP